MTKVEYNNGTKKLTIVTPERDKDGAPKVAEVTKGLEAVSGKVKKGEFEYDNIVIDSLTQGMQDTLAAMIKTNYTLMAKGAQNILNEYSGGQDSWPIYRALAESTRQLVSVSSGLAAMGMIVVCFAAQKDSPKYNKALQAGPYLLGQDFPGVAPGYYDFIGKLSDEGGYPRNVSFYSPDDSFIAKWCDDSSAEDAAGPLDFGRLFDLVGQDFGASFLIYGSYGSGKTYSIGSIPGNTLLINLEPRDPGRVLRSFIAK